MTYTPRTTFNLISCGLHDSNTNFVIPGSFILVHTLYQTHMATDVFFAPKATPNDGCMWLLMVGGKTSKANIAKVNSSFYLYLLCVF